MSKQEQKTQFNIGDSVYMNSPFGTYTGEVTSIQGEKMTIEVTSPTGKGNVWAEYEIEGTLWKKQGGDK
jgi:transcription antitermination factor NusG